MNRKVSSRPLLKPAELALEDLIKGTGYSVVGDGPRAPHVHQVKG